MTTTYLVRLKDHDGTRIAEFAGRGLRQARAGGLQAFTYRKRLRTPGAFTLWIAGDDWRLDLFDIDYQVEFWRRDPYITPAHIATLPTWMRDASIPDFYKDFEGFVRTMPIIEQSDDGTYGAIIYGRGYNDLLQSEPITWPVGSAQAAKSGAAETVAKAYVNENIGPGAGLDAEGNTRVRPGLTIEADLGTGAAWEGDRANKNLLDVIEELAEFAPADYAIVGTGAATFEFKWRDEQWGLDRTQGNGVNVPVIFSTQLRSANRMTYKASYLQDVNVVNVLGQGIGDNNKVRTVSGDNLTISPWSRRCITTQSREAEDDAILDAVGYAKLLENQAQVEVSFEAQQTTSIRYGPDITGTVSLWDYGDLVTVIYDREGNSVNRKILGITIGLQQSGEETITPELGDIDA